MPLSHGSLAYVPQTVGCRLGWVVCDLQQTSSGAYVRKERKALLDALQKSPANLWPTGTIWSFKNSNKVYGSPMLDAALQRSRGEPEAGQAMALMLQELRSAF